MRATGGALEANLARTAVEVVVPDEHAPLLEITAPWRGVHDATRELLREIHHRYPGWARTLADLHRRAMGDFHYLNGAPDGDIAIAIVCDLYAKTVREAAPDEVREGAVRRWLAYLDHVVRQSGDALPRNASVLVGALATLEGILRANPDLMPVASPGIRRLARTLVETPGVDARSAGEQALRMLRTSLDAVYAGWLAREDPADWRREIGAPVPPPEPDRRGHQPPTHADLRRMRASLATLGATSPIGRDDATELLSLPDNAQIVQGYLDEADALGRGGDYDGSVAKISWLLRVLEHPGLETAHETALRDVARTCARVLAQPSSPDRERLVRTVFGLLHRHAFPFPATVLQLVKTVGREALAAHEPDLADAVVDEVLSTDFAYPRFEGFTAEWNVRVDPSHLEAIRTYLGVIEADPVAARPLLAALVVHLRLGGVSIADSALFQRDVSALLASDVGPVYAQVKHLLKLLPVYFSEIGAEGELREVSTRIDEVLGRRDPLCNFLRKQSHVECNPHLIDFVERIGEYWATGDPTPLAQYVPRSVLDALDVDSASAGVHTVFAELARQTGSVAGIFELDLDDLRERLSRIAGTDAVDRERAELLVRIRREIRRKYALDHAGIVQRLRDFNRIDPVLIADLDRAIGEGAHDDALDRALTVLERLQAMVLRRGETEIREDIYFKRHIAVGIPSIYGSYREDRLDAMGLTFRMESLTAALIERALVEESLPAGRVDRLRIVARWLRQLHRGLRIDGFKAHGIDYALSLLDEALTRPTTTDAQFLDVFQLLSHNVESSIRARILDAYEDPLRRVIGRMLERGLLAGEPGEEAVLRHSEVFIRDLIAGTLSLQRLDALVGQMIRHLRGGAAQTTRSVAPTLDLDRSVVPLTTAPGSLGIMALGKKAFLLRRLAKIGMPVPDGFVLTTDVFLARDELAGSPTLRRRLQDRVRVELTHLERKVGANLGDRVNPLLLSVRGGAAFSMPGMLATYLNVGMSPAVIERVVATRGAWTAWDSYRRFVQSWGMGRGMARDPFDRLIADAKARSGVPRKALLSAEDMRALAHAYRDLVGQAGIVVEEDPFAQLLGCIEMVQASWDDEGARLYRRELQVADEWGTAVIVQAMVLGNLGPRSGSGVLLTSDPRRACDALELSGDFTLQGQGDDVVSGLVTTFPITERQRRREGRDVEISLEKDFPAIHQALADDARTLVETHGMNHQEIEFTFESERVDDLHLLQTRDTVVAPRTAVAAFHPSDALDRARVAAGIGVSGGALSGRVAHTAEDIAGLRARHPGEAVILLRPDTAPDDIALVLGCEGLLTALGGATSHAAVTAKRLGKTCVVGCRSLDVDERRGMSRLGPHILRSGDAISISGLDGSIYLGTHRVQLVGVRGRAQE